MPTTVNAAFNQFLTNIVNLAPTTNSSARKSRDWLIEQIHALGNSDLTFPLFYKENDIFFGSFARRTKIRELDDIDLMICLKATGSTYVENGDRVYITAPGSSRLLHSLCNANTNTLNSRMVINRFVFLLKKVPNYQNAIIKRSMESCTLDLSSYTWSFDIVPCFITEPDDQGETYYVIPDGSGDWKMTDPRKDREAVTIINQHHGGNVLNVVRILKYWNNRQTAPSIPSYLLETMVLQYYLQHKNQPASQFVDLEIPHLLNHISDSILKIVVDFKGIQGNLNTIPLADQIKVSTRAKFDYGVALKARAAEEANDHKGSIESWGKIFGPDFPTYG